MDDAIRMVISRFHNIVHLSMIDANGRVGSVAANGIGTCQPSVEDIRGELLRAHLAQHALLASNAFSVAGMTWRHTSGKLSRIDYVLVPLSDNCTILSSVVLGDVHLTLSEHDDHFPVCTHISLDPPVKGACPSPTGPRPRPKASRFLMKSPSHVADFCRRLGLPMPVDYSMSLDDSLGKFTDHVQNALGAFIDEKYKKPRKRWISVATWEVVVRSQNLRSELRRAREWTFLASVRVAFTAWMSTLPHLYSDYHVFNDIETSYRFAAYTCITYAVASKLFISSAAASKAALKADKLAYLDA